MAKKKDPDLAAFEDVIAQMDSWTPGEKYAGEPFEGHLVLASRDGYSPAMDRLIFRWCHDNTKAEDFPIFSFKHWRRRYVSMLLVPPGVDDDTLVDAAIAFCEAREPKAFTTEQLKRQRLADADDQWKAMTVPDRRLLLQEMKLNESNAQNSLPPTGGGSLIEYLADEYAAFYAKRFGDSIV